MSTGSDMRSVPNPENRN